MKFAIADNISHHDVQTMVQVFFHHMRFEVVDLPPPKGLCLTVCNDSAVLYKDGAKIAQSKEGIVKKAIYNLLVDYTGYRPP